MESTLYNLNLSGTPSTFCKKILFKELQLADGVEKNKQGE
jgi:hypothetical protein